LHTIRKLETGVTCPCDKKSKVDWAAGAGQSLKSK